jgi:chloramphenicol 3-O phosphotransferase
MNYTTKALSRNGINAIVDTVILDILEEHGWLSESVRILKESPVLFVGVHCPLTELERRERQSGNRDIGQAKWQFTRIHGHKIYDIEINTYEQSLDECVYTIKTALETEWYESAFMTLWKKMELCRTNIRILILILKSNDMFVNNKIVVYL